MIFKDKAGGITDRSLKFWHDNRNRIGSVLRVSTYLRTATKWPLRLKGSKGHELWLSGCVSGYAGEGPRGTFEIFSSLGFDVTLDRITKENVITLERKKHRFVRYGGEELLCRPCGFVASFHKLPEEQTELDLECIENGGPYCLGMHHTDVSGIVAAYKREIKEEEKKLRREMSWFETAEFALALSKSGVPQATKHQAEFKGSLVPGVAGWYCKCGYRYPEVPRWALGSNKVYQWLEPLKNAHEATE